MGQVLVDLELANGVEEALAMTGQANAAAVRRTTVNGLVDTGSVMLVLPQDLVEHLGLSIFRRVVVTYADDRKEERDVAGVVALKIGDRRMHTDCIVGPPNSKPLVGQVVLEVMDLLIDPLRRRLVPRPESPFLPLMDVRSARGA